MAGLHLLLTAAAWGGLSTDATAPHLPLREANLQQGGYQQGNYVNYAKEVWMSSNIGTAAYANDGVQRGFFGQKEIAATDVEDSPWLRVDLGQVRMVSPPPPPPPPHTPTRSCMLRPAPPAGGALSPLYPSGMSTIPLSGHNPFEDSEQELAVPASVLDALKEQLHRRDGMG